jgi:cellulose synthase/poly-beta-1,6-N-acetylglucosamine synthase-like glycosyltransferase
MLLLFATALVVQLGCWLALAVGFRRATSPPSLEPPEEPLPPVSVVVAARNEEDRLPALLAALAAQSHPDFEVVVVDDASDDATASLVEARAASDERFRLARVTDPQPPRKKHALTLGVAATRHDRLAFTDADCVPPPRWLETLAAHAATEPDAVLVGYGPYRKERSVLNAFVRYETLVTALLTAAAVGLGRPYMAVGRNFSYPRSVFEQIGGFEHSFQSLSGDDDLLVQEAHRHGIPVRYVADPATFVLSEAPVSWRRWARQKLRHTSAGRYYDRGTQLALAVFHGSTLLVWLAPLWLGWTGAGFLAARFLLQRAVLRSAMETFGERDLTLAQPVLDAGYALYNTFLAPLGAVWKPTRW